MADQSSPSGGTPAGGQELRPDAVIIEGTAHNGKPCRVVDNTGEVSRDRLEGLLRELIEQRQFGLRGISQGGEDRISIGGPRFTHVQLGDTLYRLLLFPYEARIEKF